jgi:hypothetical protein
MLCVAVSFSVLCVLLSAVQQIVLIAAECIDRNGMERIEFVTSRGKVGGLMGHDVKVAGGTVDIETGQLLIIKRCLCPITFCNYKCLYIGLFLNSAAFYTFTCNEPD